MVTSLSPLAKTQLSQYRGPGSTPGQGSGPHSRTEHAETKVPAAKTQPSPGAAKKGNNITKVKTGNTEKRHLL